MPALGPRHNSALARRYGVATLLCGFALAAQAGCPPAGFTQAALTSLKATGWRVTGPDAEASRHSLAIGLLECLAAPDPRLRDDIAFDALQTWMRKRQLDEPTLHRLRVELHARLARPADADGFAQPFAVLVLAEVVRVDRLHPFLGVEHFAQIVEAGTRYLTGLRDYRGFDSVQGWRHGVAHGADLMLQLTLNPRLDRTQADALLSAVAAQAAPPGEHFYRYGEPQRLAAPVYYLARSERLSAADWARWFAAAWPTPPATAALDQTRLARRHNLGAFLGALHLLAHEGGDAAAQERLLPGLRQALRALP